MIDTTHTNLTFHDSIGSKFIKCVNVTVVHSVHLKVKITGIYITSLLHNYKKICSFVTQRKLYNIVIKCTSVIRNIS